MISCKEFYDLLINNGIDFFTGVPDSLLKELCAYITDNTSNEKNIIAANEGNAIAIASGYHLASGKYGVVYMQNSGLGNTINPLTSLADKEVYSIPMLLMIGWRGEPNVKDEPQHIKMGKVTLSLLDSLNIPYTILDGNNHKEAIENAVVHMKNNKFPYAIVVKKNTFDKYDLKNKIQTNYHHNREGSMKLLLPLLDADDIVVSTTGMTSRELFELREFRNEDHSKDFLTVGCMGHSSSIALGIALQKKNRNVYCFDGDGATVMHMGSLSIIASLKPTNFKHILFNNGSHDSVGGQPTVGFDIDFLKIAKASGYVNVWSAETTDDIISKFNLLKNSFGPSLLEIKINKGARSDLGRPTLSPIQNKESFIWFLNNR